MFFTHPLAAITSFVNIDGPVTFLLDDLECYFFLNVVDIQPILEFKNNFRKYHPVCPKNPLRAFFLGHVIYIF